MCDDRVKSSGSLRVHFRCTAPWRLLSPEDPTLLTKNTKCSSLQALRRLIAAVRIFFLQHIVSTLQGRCICANDEPTMLGLKGDPHFI